MNDHSFTTGKDLKLQHVRFINSGGFGEVHEVRRPSVSVAIADSLPDARYKNAECILSQ